MDLNRITELAREDPGRRFLSIAHLLTPQALYEAFSRLRKDASAGVDHLTHAEYEPQAWERVQELHEALKNKRYRAHPLRRVYIQKEDGRERPISIPTVSANYTFKQYSFGMGRGLPPFSPLAGPTFPGVKDAPVIGSGDVDFARSDARDAQRAA